MSDLSWDTWREFGIGIAVGCEIGLRWGFFGLLSG